MIDGSFLRPVLPVIGPKSDRSWTGWGYGS